MMKNKVNYSYSLSLSPFTKVEQHIGGCACARMHAHPHINTETDIHTHTNIFTRKHKQKYWHIYTDADTLDPFTLVNWLTHRDSSTEVHMHRHTHRCTLTHTHSHTHTLTCTHIHKRTRTHTCTYTVLSTNLSVSAVKVAALDDFVSGINPIEAAPLVVNGQSIGPSQVLGDENDPILTIHSCTLDPGSFAKVRPEHETVNGSCKCRFRVPRQPRMVQNMKLNSVHKQKTANTETVNVLV